MTRSFHSFLDCSRWVAAFFVVIHHVRHLLLANLGLVDHPTVVVRAFYFFTGFGHEAVVIFFVISGFLVGGHTWDKWRCEGPAPLDYLSARMARIYTVLVPALLLSMLLDEAGVIWFDGSQLYSHPALYHTISMYGVVTDRLNVATLLGNLLLLQGIAVPVLGSNGPLWSLAYEWWYYLIFLIAALGIADPTAKRTIGCCMVLAALAWLLPGNLLLMGLLWIMGLILYFIVRSAAGLPHPILGALTFVGALAWARLSHNTDNIDHPETIFVSFKRDLVVAVGYSICAASMYRRSAVPKLSQVHKFLADFSYSAYLVHFPMMIFAAAVLNRFLGSRILQQPTTGSVVYAAGMTAFLYLYAFVFSSLTEVHTAAIREWIRSKAIWTTNPTT